MKKLLFVYAMLTLCSNSITIAQEDVIYNKLKPLEGKWISVNKGNDTFVISLKLKKNYELLPGIGMHQDVVIGWHTYTQNGNIKSNSLNLINEKNSFSIIFATNIDGKKYATISDFNRPKGHAFISFTLNPNNPDEAVWKIVRIATEADEFSRVYIGEQGQRELDSLNALPPIPPSELTQIPEWHMVRVKKQ